MISARSTATGQRASALKEPQGAYLSGSTHNRDMVYPSENSRERHVSRSSSQGFGLKLSQ
jgi:hypothetical protein